MTFTRKLRLLSRIALVVLGGLVAEKSVTPASAAEVTVNFDQVVLMRLSEPAADIIIGNPSIAGITPRSRTLLAITGKSFGSTNMIILNKDNEVIVEHQLSVVNSNDDYVAVTRGGARSSFACTDFCEPVLTIGDSPKNFGQVQSQIRGKASASSPGGSTR